VKKVTDPNIVATPPKQEENGEYGLLEDFGEEIECKDM
jgi:hypothetical protein